MPWIRLAVRPSDDARRDAISAALFAAGAQGLHEDGAWLVTVVEDPAPLAHAARVADPQATVEQTELPPTDWSEAWKSRIGAHELGALAIVPPWLAEGRDPARTIVIEPEMAFGTGEHPTTRGVVRLLPGVLRAGDLVADLGAGSAVLAIAAAKLGARRVAAIELDGEAIANAEANVLRNGVADRVTVIEGDAEVLLPLVAPVRVILANIISSVLTALLPAMEAALPPDGRAILSGILREERPHMVAVLEAQGWRIEAEDHEAEWWSVVIAR